MFVRVVMASAALLLTPGAWAQTNDCAKLKDPKNIAGLGADEVEQRFGDCEIPPEMFAAGWNIDSDLIGAWTTAYYAGTLQDHRYGVLDEMEQPIDDAIREFQRERGEPVTGNLTVRQLNALSRFNAGKPTNIWISGGTSAYGDDGDKPRIFMIDDYLVIEGSWWLDCPDGISDPLNKHRYECDLTDRVCHHAEMSLTLFSDDQLAASLNMDTLQVTRVEMPVIEISPFDQPGCRRPVITVNVTRVEVFQVTTQVSKCDLIPDLPAPRVARMRSSEIQSKEYRDEAEAERLALGSKRWRDFTARVKAESEAAGTPR